MLENAGKGSRLVVQGLFLCVFHWLISSVEFRTLKEQEGPPLHTLASDSKQAIDPGLPAIDC